MIVVAEGNLPLSRLVVAHLLGRVPATEIAVTAADPASVADLAEQGVEVRPEHFGDPTAGAMSFVEGDRVMLASRFDSTSMVETAISVAPAHVVLISKVAADRSRQKWHIVHESRVEQSGSAFTFLRRNVDSEAFAAAADLALRSGEFISSFNGGLVAPAARTDYAEAAAVVLTTDNHERRTYDVTGPIGLKDLGLASAFSQLGDTEIRLRQVPQRDLSSELWRAGASWEVAVALERLYGDIAADEWSTASETLEEIIGHDRVPLVEALGAEVQRLDVSHGVAWE